MLKIVVLLVSGSVVYTLTIDMNVKYHLAISLKSVLLNIIMLLWCFGHEQLFCKQFTLFTFPGFSETEVVMVG